MPVERGAGIVIFKNSSEGRKYLILRSSKQPGSNRPDFWDFSKGLLKPGEDGLGAAKREVEEETSLINIEIIDGFKETVQYFTRHTGSPVPKYVVMFLAEVKETDNIKLSWEHDKFAWLDFNATKNIISIPQMKNILEKADEFLRKSS